LKPFMFVFFAPIKAGKLRLKSAGFRLADAVGN
jgi:hypothetical protein